VRRRRATGRVAGEIDGHSARWLVVAILAYGGLVVSGVSVAWSSQAVRALHIAVDATQRRQDALLGEYSRLLIERSTLGAYQNIDQVAERQLSMTFPDSIERVTP
jgi:cell division protein FtsL